MSSETHDSMKEQDKNRNDGKRGSENKMTKLIKNDDTFTNGEMISTQSESENDDIDALDCRLMLIQRNFRTPMMSESYNPEEDHDFESQRKIYPKTAYEKLLLSESLSKCYLLGDSKSMGFSLILEALEPVEVAEGTTIVKEGEEGNMFYVIEYGKFKCSSKGKVIKIYDGKGIFGELALIASHPRPTTVTSMTNGKLWRIDRRTFRRYIAHSAYETRNLYMNLINRFPLFQKLQENEKQNLLETMKPEIYENGQVIIRQGEAAEHMYFVIKGNVCLKRTQGKGKESLMFCGEGDYFGELALISKTARTASAISVGQSTLASIEINVFERVLGKCVDLIKRIFDDYYEAIKNLFGIETIENIRLR